MNQSGDLLAVTKSCAKDLAAKSNFVVAKAAKIVANFELQDLCPQLVGAFQRFMKNPVTTDKGCAAKSAAVSALAALAVPAHEVYLAGLRHVQMEPSFGRSVDTAAGLRVASAMGLVASGYADALIEILPLLVDPETDARIGAVRAVAGLGTSEAVAVLRLKVLARDEPEVIGECFTALLALAPAQSLPFAGEYLKYKDSVIAEAAALAIGQSREPAAAEVLIQAWRPDLEETVRRAILLGLALVRQETAFEFLFSVVADAIESRAVEAITTLGTYRHDDRIRRRLESIIATRSSKQLARTFHAEFGAGAS